MVVGNGRVHSDIELQCKMETIFRFETNASIKIIINKIVDNVVRFDPIEEMAFHDA
jgi:hypothetical protein